MADLVVDLRSDLLAPRSTAVMQAVCDAMRESPTFLPGESVHERRLTDTVCELLGMEAGVFVPTCTMANQIAVRLWLPQGGRVAADRLCHLFTVEAAGLQFTGAIPHVLSSEGGHVTPDSVRAFADAEMAGPSMLWLENTHNFGGGTVIPDGWKDQIAQICAERGTPLHLDGSRLWNAAVASNADLSRLSQGASTVAISMNKALGAPMGAILAGSKEAIDAATNLRMAMSGEWRPVGPMAAGAVAAIDDWRERLSLDHANTFELATMLKLKLGREVVSSPPTNLLVLQCPDEKAVEIATLAAKRGIRVLPIGSSMIRLAVHGGLSAKNLSATVDGLVSAWDGALGLRESSSAPRPTTH